jgi:pyruvate,water dikinase
MNENQKPIDVLIHDLRERAKELNCMYRIQELLGNPVIAIDDLCQGIINVLPPAWQYPDVCQARITFGGKTYQTPDFRESSWEQSADVVVHGETVGKISVYYIQEMPASDEGPFLKEERKLINTIAEQFGIYILNQQLRQVFENHLKAAEERQSDWSIILNLLKRTEPMLLMRISRKMINYLSWRGVKEAEKLFELFNPAYQEGSELLNANRPYQQQQISNILALSDEVFSIADKHLSREVILDNIQNWIKEDRSGFLINILVNPSSSLDEIYAEIERYQHLAHQGIELTDPREKWFRVALIRRLLNDQRHFMSVAKNYIDINDFGDFTRRVIHPNNSHGHLGGKSSGLFLAAKILKHSLREEKLLQNIKTPKTWYLTSDSIFSFMSYNDLEDLVEQKYKDFGHVRQEYPYIVHVFKNSTLSPEIVKGLSLALDDFGDVPLIVRSSSLLEDEPRRIFAGKYKSLFIANRGNKEERLAALIDAIVEVYASMFSPDPIEYRYEHKLIDDHEEMGIMIQEVVGRQVGHYYFPTFAGVAFSNNEFRWSSRIKREDGLIRLVPGLGTRAVDRLSDDYPILISPGQPRLRVNVTLGEIIHYSPKKMDVINLQSRTFETIDLHTLLKEHGREVPLVNDLVSIIKQDRLQQPSSLGVNFDSDDFIVAFEGLFTRTPFLKQVKTILNVLEEALESPVDIEFAHDGTNFFLLQCRAQSYRDDCIPASLPKDIPSSRIIFSANRYISNGTAADITHIVYVNPQKYSELASHQDLIAVGRVIGQLNQILPKRQFILMGPGRWGSRGDIRMGVSVTYSDICNTAMLIEIAWKRDDIVPEPSFGTHFFQDLVEGSIRYLPIYPNDIGVLFNEQFLLTQRNILPEILPDWARLSEVIQVIDIPTSTNGKVMQVLMNADIEKAVAILNEPSRAIELDRKKAEALPYQETTEDHWRWRLHAVESIAAQLDPKRFGVKAFYLFGSTKNATAGPDSDIDILIHFTGMENQRKELLTWFEGWSLSLSQINYLRTGYKSNGLLDVHLVTDEEVQNRSGYAAMIGSLQDAARPLAIGTGLR